MAEDEETYIVEWREGGQDYATVSGWDGAVRLGLQKTRANCRVTILTADREIVATQVGIASWDAWRVYEQWTT